jgi:hypothetical protein
MAGLMVVFILTQSIFNRYLIGVGNPYSLWILMLILQVNLGSRATGSLPIGRATFSHRNTPRTTRIGA